MVLLVGITAVGLGQKEPKVVTMVISTNYNNYGMCCRKFICINDNIDHNKEGADVVSTKGYNSEQIMNSHDRLEWC